MTNFIKVSNNAITAGSEQHLNMEELYLYSTISSMKNIDGIYITCISTIGDIGNIRYANRDVRNNKAIKDMLISLMDKGLITIHLKDGSVATEEIRANDTIKITINEVKDGHAQVPIAQINKIDSLSDYYIYVATKRWENKKNDYGVCRNSFENWADILQIAPSTAQKYIQQAISNKVVYVNTGSYNKTGKQSMNEYKCTPFTAEQKSTAQKIKDNKSATEHDESVSEQSESVVDISVSEQSEQPQVAHSEPQESPIDDDLMNSTISIFSNFLDDDGNDSFPVADDYFIVMQVEQDIKDRKRKATKLEQELSNKCKWRMDMMKRSAMAKMKMDKEIAKAEKMLAEQNGELDEQVDEQVERKGNVVPFKVVEQKTEQQKKQYIDMSKYF